MAFQQDTTIREFPAKLRLSRRCFGGGVFLLLLLLLLLLFVVLLEIRMLLCRGFVVCLLVCLFVVLKGMYSPPFVCLYLKRLAKVRGRSRSGPF